MRLFGRRGEGRGELNEPWGVAIDSSDRVYVSQWDNHCVSVFTSEGQFVMSFGTGGLVDGLAVDSGVLYVSGLFCFDFCVVCLLQ